MEPTVGSFNFNAAPVVVASVSAQGDTDLEEAAEIARTEIIPELQAIPGVASADLAGGLEDRLVITLDPQEMAEAGVSMQQAIGVLQANNITIPGGELPTDEARIPVSTIGRFDSVEEIENLVVGVRQPRRADPVAPAAPTPSRAPRPVAAPAAPVAPTPVTIGEIGTVEILSQATTGYGRTNGQPSVTISVSKTSTANTVTVAQDVQAKLDEIAARHPGEIEIVTVADQSVFILESSEGLLREGGLGAIFAVLTIFAFLLNVRSTFVAAVSIPLSILTALVIMQFAGITLNILTLGGLAVAVGRVVDDSIVVLENIYRHRALGDDRLKAVTDGPREVAGAITASTFTTVAVFLPLGFAGGFVSQFFLSFSLTVTFALLASLVVALTVVPVLAYFLVDKVSHDVDESGEPRRSRWIQLYDPAIRWVLRSRWTKRGDGRRSRRPVRRCRRASFRCSRRRSSTPAPRRSSRSRSRRRAAPAPSRSSSAPSRPRRSSSPIPTSSSSRRACPARATSASRRSSRPSSAGRPTAPRWSSASIPRRTSSRRSTSSPPTSIPSPPTATR